MIINSKGKKIPKNRLEQDSCEAIEDYLMDCSAKKTKKCNDNSTQTLTIINPPIIEENEFSSIILEYQKRSKGNIFMANNYIPFFDEENNNEENIIFNTDNYNEKYIQDDDKYNTYSKEFYNINNVGNISVKDTVYCSAKKQKLIQQKMLNKCLSESKMSINNQIRKKKLINCKNHVVKKRIINNTKRILFLNDNNLEQDENIINNWKYLSKKYILNSQELTKKEINLIIYNLINNNKKNKRLFKTNDKLILNNNRNNNINIIKEDSKEQEEIKNFIEKKRKAYKKNLSISNNDNVIISEKSLNKQNYVENKNFSTKNDFLKNILKYKIIKDKNIKKIRYDKDTLKNYEISFNSLKKIIQLIICNDKKLILKNEYHIIISKYISEIFIYKNKFLSNKNINELQDKNRNKYINIINNKINIFLQKIKELKLIYLYCINNSKDIKNQNNTEKANEIRNIYNDIIDILNNKINNKQISLEICQQLITGLRKNEQLR